MPTPVQPLCAEKVKAFRQDNGWSQELLAKASGLSLRTIQRVEKDGGGSAETQLALAAAFNISPKELFQTSSTPDVNWKRKNIMQSAFALIVVAAAVYMLITLGGDIGMFSDLLSALFLVLFMYAGTTIAFGSHGLVKSITGLSYLFASDISSSPATAYLAEIYKKQIYFLYGGSLIGLITGAIAILSHFDQIGSEAGLYAAYAVNLLILLYAAIIAEGILRPLSAKLTSRDIANKFIEQ